MVIFFFGGWGRGGGGPRDNDIRFCDSFIAAIFGDKKFSLLFFFLPLFSITLDTDEKALKAFI